MEQTELLSIQASDGLSECRLSGNLLESLIERGNDNQNRVSLPFTKQMIEDFAAWQSSATPCPAVGWAVESVCKVAAVADFLADDIVLNHACAEIARRINCETDVRLCDEAFAVVPRACLERIALKLDRDTAAQLLSVWNVGDDMAVSRIPTGGFHVCQHCTQWAVQRMSQSVACARDSCAADQIARGERFDFDDLVPPVAIIHAGATSPAGSDDDDDDMELVAAGHIIDLDEMSDEDEVDPNPGSEIEQWIDALGLAAADPIGFVRENHAVIVQHQRWGVELKHVWRRQRREYAAGRASAPPPLLRCCLAAAVGHHFDRAWERLVPRSSDRDKCIVCACKRESFPLVPVIDDVCKRLAIRFAARRAEIELCADNPEYIASNRRTRAYLRSLNPEREWMMDTANLPTVCSLAGICQGCGLETCSGTLCCATSMGMTRCVRLRNAPLIRDCSVRVSREYADRLSRPVPAPRHISRRRKNRQASRDARPKCMVCQNILPAPRDPCQPSLPTTCETCKKCCRSPECDEHFPPVGHVIDAQFSSFHPPPLLNFSI